MTEPSIADLRAARRELDDVIREIQQVPGFEDFLAAPGFPDIARAAADQPLVYLAAADEGGFALVVRGSGVTPIELPLLTSAKVHELVEKYRRCVERIRRDSRNQELRKEWRGFLDDATQWLWDAAMGDVLTGLGQAAETTLVPCGQLGLLPLHAAWTADESAVTGRRHAIDMVAFAYSANARARETCRRRAADRSVERILAVADPRSTGAGLEDTQAEAVIAAQSCPQREVLKGEQVTVAELERGLAVADVLHFGGHGRAHLTAPLTSYLLLADGARLSLEQILRMRLETRLAVLSACQTAVLGIDLPDEVVNLPTGLVQAGVAGVLATMWGVGQHASALLTATFYRHWQGGSPAVALARAQRWLRDATVGELEEDWGRAMTAGEGWLPAEAGERLLARMLDLHEDIDERPWSAIDAWAAFAFTGA
ncbi:hypothetical protein GCM10029964_061580 [Kibdelosporangium lantanae]